MVIGIYCRFSKVVDDIQSQSSLQHQLNNGKKYCEDNGFEYRVYSETISGGIKMDDRVEGSRLINDIELGVIDGVWVDKEDRLYRDFDETIIFKMLLKKHKIKYYISNNEVDFENDNDKITNTILSLMSDIEKKNISRRMRRGLVDRLNRGKGMGRVDFGFVKENDEYSIDEKVKEKIINCYRYYVNKEWDRLTDWMFYCRKKLDLNKSTQWYYDLYNNRNYNGEKVIKYQQKEYIIKLPKIIKDDLYNRFCEKFKKQKENSKGNNKKNDFTNILSGKVRCGCCNNKLHINRSVKSGFRNLRCRFGGNKFKELYVGKKRNIPKHTTTLRYDFISELVYKGVVNILLNSYLIKEEFKNKYHNDFKVDEVRSDIVKWKRELNNIKKRELRLEDSLLDGLISKENIVKHKDKLQLERIRVEGYILSLEDDIKTNKQSNKIVKWIDVFKKEYSKENMSKKSTKQKSDIISKYVDCVYVKGNYKFFEVDLRLKIPIINDKLKFDKSKYREFIKNGGKSSDFGKEFVVVKGSKTIKEKFCLNNSNFSLNKSNTFFNIIIDVKYNKEVESGFEFVDISIE